MNSEEEPNDEFLEQLPSQLEAWQHERIINARQVAAILARYGLPHEAVVRGWLFRRMTAILAIFGAILVGSGIIAQVAARGQELDLPRGLKVALMIGAIIFLYSLGYYLRYHSPFPVVGGAVIFIGALMYGATLFLVGQIYSIKANEPELPMLWFLGVLPLAYLTRYAPIFAAALAIASVWLGSQAIFSMKDTHFEELIGVRTIALFLMLGVLYYLLSPLHERFEATKELRRPPQFLGLGGVLAALYLLGFRFWSDDLADRQIPDLPGSLLAIYAIITALAVVAALATVYLWQRERPTLPYEAGAGLLLLGLGFIAVYVPFDDPDAYVLLFNALLLGIIIGSVALGLLRRQEGYMNTAVAFFALLVITRYFELVEGALGISAGLLLLVAALFLEWYRRRLLPRLRKG